MIILKTTPRMNLVINEDDLMNDNKENIKVMFQNRIYNVKGWQCISDPTVRPLYSNLRDEVSENIDDAIKMMEHYKSKLMKQVPAPAPQTSGLTSKLEEMLVEVLAKQSADTVLEYAKPLIKQHIIEEFGVLPVKHEVSTPTFTAEFQGITHEKFDDVLNLVNLDIPVFLSGQAGTGKNVICKQVAEALKLDFYFTNAVTQEYQLKGFIDANGKYHETQFYQAFTKGGLFFLDEIDGSIPETLIILNSAIANKYFDFPTGRCEAHPNFRVISAGNTVGTGADIEYTGRFQLDASSLDRFALIQIDYSKNIQNALSNNDDALVEFAEAFRNVANKAGIRCLFTYRSIERIAKLNEVFELPKVLKISLIKGLNVDDIKIIVKHVKNITQAGNKYVLALEELAK